MEKISKSVVVQFLAVLALIGMLSGCANNNDHQIQRQLNSFESACQAGDLNAILNCCDPQIVKPIKSTLCFLGTDLAQVSDLVYGIIGLGDMVLQDEHQIQEMLSSLNFQLKACEYNETKDYCNATVAVSCELYDEYYEEDAIIPFVLRDEVWFLAMN